jgi:hypothetical protein
LKGLAQALVASYKVSVHRASEVTKFCRSMWYYKKIGCNDQVIRMRMKEIKETRVRYGLKESLHCSAERVSKTAITEFIGFISWKV